MHRTLTPILRLMIVVSALCVTSLAWAHPALTTSETVYFSRDGDDIEVLVYLTHDVLAFALNDTSARITDEQMYHLLDGPREDLEAALEDGRERFEAGFKVFADGTPVETTLLESPDLSTIDQWRKESKGVRLALPIKFDFKVRAMIPRGTEKVQLQAPSVLGELILVLIRQGSEPMYLPLGAGEKSPAFDVSKLWAISPPAIEPQSEQGESPEPEESGDNASQPKTTSDNAPQSTNASEQTHAKPESTPPEVSAAGIIWRYIVLGYKHIIPDGHDHELFILGLFLLNIKLKDLLWQTTAFTIAHTTTLTLATFHLVSAPSSIVEPLIALSIAAIAIENLFAKEVHPWRIAIAFFFGLIHGLGFASGLMEIGMPTAQVLTALIGFSLGVEGGHLSIIALAFLTIGWFKHKKWYRARISIPLSIIIACIALYWFVERVI